MKYRNKMVEDIVKGIREIKTDKIEIEKIVSNEQELLIRVGMLLGIRACIDVIGECIERGE